MKRDDFRRATPPVPTHFLRAMDDGLRRIEQMDRKKNGFKKGTLIAVALIAVLLLSTALAGGARFGIFDFFNQSVEGIVPPVGAEKAIESDVAAKGCNYGSIAVEEAAYSEGNYTVVVHINANNGVGFGYPEMTITNAESEEYAFSEKRFEDGSMSFMFEGSVSGTAPETLECEVSVNFAEGNTHLEQLTLPFSLTQSAGLRARLIPQSTGERWSVESAELSFGKVTGTMEVQYRYLPLDDELMGITIYLFAEDGTNLLGDGGRMDSTNLEDGWTLCHEISGIQSFSELPERLYLQAKVIGEDRWLERIECSVERIE